SSDLYCNTNATIKIHFTERKRAMNPAVDNEFQQWLSQINQVCGNFTGRLLTERYTGVLDTHFAKGLKLSTVTTSGVNLSRTWQEVKG
ncbi:Transcriptional activator feaR, partial [human gut metagenome]